LRGPNRIEGEDEKEEEKEDELLKSEWRASTMHLES